MAGRQDAAKVVPRAGKPARMARVGCDESSEEGGEKRPFVVRLDGGL
jgi:hypothetical protein